MAVRAILRTIRETEGMPENEAFAVEAQVGLAVFASEDAKEGPRAFAEKRQARTSATAECPWPLGAQDHCLTSWYQEGFGIAHRPVHRDLAGAGG